VPRVLPEYKAQAKLRIASAGFALFSEKGYRRTTMDDIAKKVGVSKGDLYLYFPSKIDLLREIQLASQRHSREVMFRDFGEAITPEALVRVFDREIAALDDPKITSLWIEILLEAVVDPNIARVLRDDYLADLQAVRRVLAKFRRRAPGSTRASLDDVARAVLLQFHGAALQLALGASRSEMRRALRAGLRALLQSEIPGAGRADRPPK